MKLLLYSAILARLARVRDVEGTPAYLAPKKGEKTADLPPQVIKTLGLWNENVAQITKQRPFPIPAVFVEFRPILWRQLGRRAKCADVDVRLHIVTATLATTNSPYEEQALYRFALMRAIEQALVGFSGTDGEGRQFGTFVQSEDETDHDHEEVREDIAMWTTYCIDASVIERNLITTPFKVTLDDGNVFTFAFNEEFV